MSHIKDVSDEFNDLKINISKMIIIHNFNNLDSHFWTYLAILSHDAYWEKEKLPNLSKLIKTLEDEQIHLSNENRETANYTYSSKPKKRKPSE